jgi:hypothetical protein
VNVVVSMAVFIALIPDFGNMLGTRAKAGVSFVAGVVLLLDTILPLFIGRDSPERHEDYAKYIMGYKDSLDETRDEPTMSVDVKQARLTETIALAQLNLRDVRAKSPLLVKKAGQLH